MNTPFLFQPSPSFTPRLSPPLPYHHLSIHASFLPSFPPSLSPSVFSPHFPSTSLLPFLPAYNFPLTFNPRFPPCLSPSISPRPSPPQFSLLPMHVRRFPFCLPHQNPLWLTPPAPLPPPLRFSASLLSSHPCTFLRHTLCFPFFLALYPPRADTFCIPPLILPLHPFITCHFAFHATLQVVFACMLPFSHPLTLPFSHPLMLSCPCRNIRRQIRLRDECPSQLDLQARAGGQAVGG
ncbi:unnamed protein product [Closterium sp. NIES-65]|nr:unnamed protein product [Closterium sp. NIES-65]